MKRKITQGLLRKIRPAPGRRIVIRDTELPGFHAVVGATRTSFAVDYTDSRGQRVRGEVVGHWGPMNADQGRAAAQRRIGARKFGVGDDDAPPFGALLDAFLAWAERHCRTGHKDRLRADRHLESLRTLTADVITRGDVVRLVRDVGETSCGRESCADCQGHQVEANRVAALVRRVYYWAEAEGLYQGRNPAARLRRALYPEPRRHDRSVTPAEVARLVIAVWGQPNPYTRATIWLLLLTGLRRSEAHWLEWSRVNLGSAELVMPGRHKLPPGCLWLPPDQSKTGRALTLPLSTAVQEILGSLDRRGPFVFPGRRLGDGQPGPLRKIDGQWRRVRSAAGCPELTLHDLRATVASWMRQAGVERRVRLAALNHARPRDVHDRYEDAPGRGELRRALEQHSRQVLQAAGVARASSLVWPDERSTAQILDFPADAESS